MGAERSLVSARARSCLRQAAAADTDLPSVGSAPLAPLDRLTSLWRSLELVEFGKFGLANLEKYKLAVVW